jgi:hypothetical protein
MAKRESGSESRIESVTVPREAQITECMHCAGKVWMQPLDPSIKAQKFRAINVPDGTVHMCKGLKEAILRNSRKQK